jgi:hypothetical protein
VQLECLPLWPCASRWECVTVQLECLPLLAVREQPGRGRRSVRHTRARTNPPGRAEQLEEQGRSVAAMASALERSVDLGDVQLLRAEVGRQVGR